jgi:hypothetical protein
VAKVRVEDNIFVVQEKGVNRQTETNEVDNSSIDTPMLMKSGRYCTSSAV